MDLKIEDYLTEAEIKRAFLDEVRLQARAFLSDSNDINVSISNAAYYMVYKMVDDSFDGELEEVLKANIKGQITNLSSFNIFKKPDVWDAETNAPYKYLMECFEEMKPRVKSRFTKALDERVDEESIRMVKYEMADLFTQWANEKFTSE